LGTPNFSLAWLNLITGKVPVRRHRGVTSISVRDAAIPLGTPDFSPAYFSSTLTKGKGQSPGAQNPLTRDNTHGHPHSYILYFFKKRSITHAFLVV
ncbi:MAG TPA: hypothetical protein PLO75_08475, partial [Thermotogota bacterium]|nr:hypothetical protein [Thermotogota bacterium]